MALREQTLECWCLGVVGLNPAQVEVMVDLSGIVAVMLGPASVLHSRVYDLSVRPQFLGPRLHDGPLAVVCRGR